MRWIGLTAMAPMLLATSVRAGDVYFWRDGSGLPHYSNVPVASGRDVEVYDTDAAPTSPEPDRSSDPRTPVAEGDAPSSEVAAAPADDTYSDAASLRRRALERELHDGQARLQQIQHEMADQAAARIRTSTQGVAGAGYLRANALDVQSPDEQRLAAEKASIEQRLAATHKAYGALHDEVTARFGRTPDWWTNAR